MKSIKIKDIVSVTNGSLLCGNNEDEVTKISIDSRKIEPNDTYIAIKGENFDGNNFIKDAIDKGAKTCIVNIDYIDNRANIIKVNDTVDAFQKIAKYKRTLFNGEVIAITGSVGKTSTKDIVASVISTEYKTLKTKGNLNGQIGLPMTIMELEDQEKLVIEMGMSYKGELSRLTNIVKPNIAVITNIGTSHIGNLGSRENILKAKLEILEGLNKNGKVVINNDNDLLHKWYLENKDRYNIYTYGIENTSDFVATNIKYNETSSSFEVMINNEKHNILVPVGGKHFIYNALCAIVVGKICNISPEKIKNGIQGFELTKRRMESIDGIGNSIIINDCYNANYDSMKAGIEYLSKIKDKRKIAVLGDMLELGEYSAKLHENVGDEVVKNKIDILITVGKEAENIAKSAINNGMNTENIFMLRTNSDAVKILKQILTKNDIALVKASNGMHFNEIVDEIKMEE